MAYIVTDYMPLKMPIPGSREPAQIALINENSQTIAGHDHATGGGIPVAVLRAGLTANRPGPTQAGAFWFGTDTNLASLSTGTAWVDFVTAGSADVTLLDPVVRDSIRFGPEGTTTTDVVLQRSGSSDLLLGGSPLLTEAAGDVRYKPISYTPPPVDLTAYYTKTESDSRYVNTAGDSVTGSLNVAGSLSQAGQAVLTKPQADVYYVARDLADAKGDLFVASGDAALSRLPIGTNGYVLTADDAQTLGVRWAPSTGGGGGSDATYTHMQSTAAVVWVVTHNLSKYPAVDVVDSGGSTIIPDVHYDSTAQVTLTFGSATSGRVFCN